MLRKSLTFVLPLLALIMAWQSVVLLGDIPRYFLPTPWQVLEVFRSNFALLWHHTLITGSEVLLGLLIGCVLGVVSALGIAWCKSLEVIMLPLLIVTQVLPMFALAPLFILWLGYGIASKIAITTIMVFFPVTSNFLDGLSSTPNALIEMASMAGASRFTQLTLIRVPYALPTLASGMRMACVFAPIGAVVGEWVGASQGLGFLIVTSNARLQVGLMFAALVILVILSLALYYGCDALSRRVLFWHK